MSIQQMIYFNEICKHKGLREAAGSLGISQSTLSLSIRRLEEEFGTKLFTREHRKMELTDAGRFYLAQCGPLLEQYNEITEHVTEKMESRVFEAAFAPSLGVFMASAAQNLEKWIPTGRKAVYREAAACPRLEELIQGRPGLYLSYLSHSSEEKENGICRKILRKDTWSITCSRALMEQLSLDSCQSSLQLIHKLMELPVCQYMGEQELYERPLFFLAGKVYSSYAQLHTVLSFVAKERLITVLPHLIVLQEPGFCSFPLPSAPPIYLTAAYCDHGPDAPIVKNMIQSLQNHCF